MGQKVSPVGFRTGVTIGWKSRWFAPKSNYGEFLVEDEQLRRFIDKRLNRQPQYAAISSIEIERTREEVKIALRTARPGIVIGARGAEVERLKNELEELTDRRVNINIIEVKNPDLDAQLIAESIAEQLRRRASFRRTVKQRAEATMQAGAKGVKIQISGRLGGAEMSRSETVIMGSIPLHTLEANVAYGFTPCFTTYGAIGVKVWIYRGMFGDEAVDQDSTADAAKTRARRRRERRTQVRTARVERKPAGEAPQAQAAPAAQEPAPPAQPPAAEEEAPQQAAASEQAPGAAPQPGEPGEPAADEQGAENQ